MPNDPNQYNHDPMPPSQEELRTGFNDAAALAALIGTHWNPYPTALRRFLDPNVYNNNAEVFDYSRNPITPGIGSTATHGGSPPSRELRWSDGDNRYAVEVIAVYNDPQYPEVDDSDEEDEDEPEGEYDEDESGDEQSESDATMAEIEQAIADLGLHVTERPKKTIHLRVSRLPPKADTPHPAEPIATSRIRAELFNTPGSGVPRYSIADVAGTDRPATQKELQILREAAASIKRMLGKEAPPQ